MKRMQFTQHNFDTFCAHRDNCLRRRRPLCRSQEVLLSSSRPRQKVTAQSLAMLRASFVRAGGFTKRFPRHGRSGQAGGNGRRTPRVSVRLFRHGRRYVLPLRFLQSGNLAPGFVSLVDVTTTQSMYHTALLTTRINVMAIVIIVMDILTSTTNVPVLTPE